MRKLQWGEHKAQTQAGGWWSGPGRKQPGDFQFQPFPKGVTLRQPWGSGGRCGDSSQIRVIGKIRLVVPVLTDPHPQPLSELLLLSRRKGLGIYLQLLILGWPFWCPELNWAKSQLFPEDQFPFWFYCDPGYGISLALCKVTAIFLDGAKTETRRDGDGETWRAHLFLK